VSTCTLTSLLTVFINFLLYSKNDANNKNRISIPTPIHIAIIIQPFDAKIILNIPCLSSPSFIVKNPEELHREGRSESKNASHIASRTAN
jgi:hypothetical protein